MGIQFKKYILGWDKKLKKKFFKKQLRKKIKTQMEQDIALENIIGMIGEMHGPKCKICKDKFAPYDCIVCNECNESIQRLRG